MNIFGKTLRMRAWPSRAARHLVCSVLVSNVLIGIALLTGYNAPAKAAESTVPALRCVRIKKQSNCMGSIQEAIDAAQPGDIVIVFPGEYLENIVLRPGVKVISDGGPDVTTIRGDGTLGTVRSYSAEIGRDTKIEGFTITGGNNPYYGGGIDIRNSSPTIAYVKVINNQAKHGGGIAVWYNSSMVIPPNPLIINSEIRDNHGTNTGGGIDLRGSLANAVIYDSTIANNRTSWIGGGMSILQSSPTISNTVISGNTAENGAGIGIWHAGAAEAIAHPHIIDSLIHNNHSSKTGAGIEVQGNMSDATIENTTIRDNTADIQGGGVRLFSGKVTVLNSTLTGNWAQQSGGGIRLACNYEQHRSVVKGNTIDSNYGGRGGGLDIEECPQLLLENNTITSNHAHDGGGLSLKNSNGHIVNNVIRGNYNPADTGAGQGGGIIITHQSAPTVENNTIAQNIATCDAGGLGVYYGAAPDITGNQIVDNKAIGTGHCGVGGGVKFFDKTGGKFRHNTIERNEANYGGGGIILERESVPLIESNLFAENQAAGPGGGLLVQTGSSPLIANNYIIKNRSLDQYRPGRGDGILSFSQGSTIINNTIVGNGDGEGIHIRDPKPGLNILNNIVTGFHIGIALSWAPEHDHDAAVIRNNNFWENNIHYADGLNVDSNAQFIGDPTFVNSISTELLVENLQLQSDSAAIEQGTSTGAPQTDYFGNERPIHNNIDIGAYEYTGELPAQTGNENPGNENPGNENPGNENPGDENPGNENPGNENPGDENPGNEETDTKVFLPSLRKTGK